MPTNRQSLLRVVHDLRRYLEWQRAGGAVGVVPAGEQARARHASLAKALEQKKLDRLKASFAAPSAPEPAQQRPEPARAAQAEPTQPAEQPAASVPSFEPPAPKPTQTPEQSGEVAAGGDALWKRFGSRPQRRFADAADSPDAAPGTDGAAPPTATTPDDMDDMDERFAPPEGAIEPSQMSPAAKLGYLRNYLGDCQRCGLCESRTNIVFGVGNPGADLVFVGEAPGYNEDLQGEPFVGNAGQLLDKMIGAMGLSRQDVYICNVIKCRPPDNRDPQVDEIRECAPFLKKQLEVIAPKVIVTVGRFASQTLLQIDESMGRMRGNWHDYNGVPVMPTYHPAYLLRNEEAKAPAWSDLKQVMAKLGLAG